MPLDFAEVFVELVGTSLVLQTLVGRIIIALMNLLGASLMLVWRDPSERASVALDSRPAS
jgi:ZIP family zinc transporter